MFRRALIISSVLILALHSGARADDAATAFLKRAGQALESVRSMETRVSVTMTTHGPDSPLSMGGESPFQIGIVKFLRPNYLRFDLWSSDKPIVGTPSLRTPHQVIACDGRTYWKVQADGTYTKAAVSKDPHEILGDPTLVVPLTARELIGIDTGGEVKLAGFETWKGQKCQVVQDTETDPSHPNVKMIFRMFFGPDLLLRGATAQVGKDHAEIVFHAMAAGAHLSRSDFRFHLPRFARREVAASGDQNQGAAMQNQAAAIKMDAVSRRLLARAARKMRNARAIVADCETAHTLTRTDHTSTLISDEHATILLMKPGYLHIKKDERFKSLRKSGKIHIWTHQALDNSNGKTLLTYWDPVKKLYDEKGVTSDVSALEERVPLFFTGFFAPDTDIYQKSFSISALRYTGTDRWHGETYRLIQGDGADTETGIQSANHLALWIGGDDVIHRVVFRMHMTLEGKVSDAIDDHMLTHVQFSPRIDKTAFVYRLPADAKKISPMQYYSQLAAKNAPQPVANGTVAPDFTVYDPTGKPVKLSDYKGKVVVIDFWATWCGPCQASLPDTNGAAHKFQDKDVVFLAINVWDKKDAFDQWLPQHKQLDALNFVIDTTPGQGQDVASKLYHVTGIPTQFVIGKDGKVAKCLVGNSGSSASLEAALQSAVAN